jgi:hypothetical protein
MPFGRSLAGTVLTEDDLLGGIIEAPRAPARGQRSPGIPQCSK